jgi:hypothetical protein
MLKRLQEWLRPTPKTAEELAAEHEAEALRQQVETQRMGALKGAPQFTHGGKESR